MDLTNLSHFRKHIQQAQLPEREHLQHAEGHLRWEVQALEAAEHEHDTSAGGEGRPRLDWRQLDVQAQSPACAQALFAGGLADKSSDFLVECNGDSVVPEAAAQSRH